MNQRLQGPRGALRLTFSLSPHSTSVKISTEISTRSVDVYVGNADTTGKRIRERE
jgi:hypothetical protein